MRMQTFNKTTNPRKEKRATSLSNSKQCRSAPSGYHKSNRTRYTHESSRFPSACLRLRSLIANHLAHHYSSSYPRYWRANIPTLCDDLLLHRRAMTSGHAPSTTPTLPNRCERCLSIEWKHVQGQLTQHRSFGICWHMSDGRRRHCLVNLLGGWGHG